MFDIEVNGSGELVVSVGSHFLQNSPFEFYSTFELISEAKDAIDQYGGQKYADSQKEC